MASEILFTEHAWRDYLFWQRTDRRVLKRINELIRDAARSPSQRRIEQALEPLRDDLRGCWSRRIDSEHRLVYEAREGQIRIIACRYHYR